MPWRVTSSPRKDAVKSSTWVVSMFLACTIAGARGEEPVRLAGHPRLYVTAADLPRLRKLRTTGVHEMIWKNLIGSAEWCLALEPRTRWIEPVAPDPRYENLYDRFYAIMRDLAVTEHLAFAYALSEDARYGDAARRWILASCRVWQREAEGTPDGAKAYAVARLLKGIAVGYDLAFDRLDDAEKREVRRRSSESGKRITPAISARRPSPGRASRPTTRRSNGDRSACWPWHFWAMCPRPTSG